MTLEQFRQKYKKIPDAPGVYFFLSKTKKILYIGKAASLRDRVRSYFARDLMESRGPLLVQMLQKTSSIDYRQTDSVLEALLLEASLIRGNKPSYNTELKDDKSFNYVIITKEDFPRVLLARGKDLEQLRKSNPSGQRESPAGNSLKSRAVALDRRLTGLQGSFTALPIFGPFPHGLQLREAMKLIRKIFPYRDDKCNPGQKRPCFNRQIGLCPGVCTGEITKKEYLKIIRHIILLFKGKKKQLLKTLAREMKSAAKEENFELAKELRRQIFALQHIQDVSLIKEEYRSTALTASRIESYDVAHLGGLANVGVMAVVENGVANKSEYRKFKIKTAGAGDDAGALREIISRRLGHDEWPMPRVIVVDGASAQMNATKKVFREYGMEIPVVGVVKDEKHRPRGILGDKKIIAGLEKDILLANAEAHRFAIAYHRKKIRKNY